MRPKEDSEFDNSSTGHVTTVSPLPRWWWHIIVAGFAFAAGGAVYRADHRAAGSPAQKPHSNLPAASLPAAAVSGSLDLCKESSNAVVPPKTRGFVLNWYITQLRAELLQAKMTLPSDFSARVDRAISENVATELIDGHPKQTLDSGRRLVTRDLNRISLSRAYLCNTVDLTSANTAAITDALAREASTVSEAAIGAAVEDATRLLKAPQSVTTEPKQQRPAR